jgi:hypothetical protein
MGNIDKLAKMGKVIIDCWRMLKDISFGEGVKYIKLGSYIK